MRFGSVIACAAMVPLLVAATQPILLQPSSRWVLDYAENSCRLIRTFGEGKAKTVLAFESEAPGAVDMLIAGKPLDNNAEEVPARFLPLQGKPMKGRTATTTESGDPAILWSRVALLPDDVVEMIEKKGAEHRIKPGVRPPPLDLVERAAWKSQRQDFASKTTEVEIQSRRNRPVVLETGSLGEPIRMFDKCSRDSLKDWGVDPDLEDKIVRAPWAPSPTSWFSAEDYPPDMLRKGQESDVKVRLLVDASGKVTKCTSLSHFTEPEFNQRACDKFMQRAHFEPAELADGTKVPSFYTNHIVFRIGH